MKSPIRNKRMFKAGTGDLTLRARDFPHRIECAYPLISLFDGVRHLGCLQASCCRLTMASPQNLIYFVS